jgi:hypothetical protein
MLFGWVKVTESWGKNNTGKIGNIFLLSKTKISPPKLNVPIKKEQKCVKRQFQYENNQFNFAA